MASSNPASSSAEALTMPHADEGGSSGALTPPIVGSAPDTTFRDVRDNGFLVAPGFRQRVKMQRACQNLLEECVGDLPGMILAADEAVDQQLRRPADGRNGRQLESGIGGQAADWAANHEAPQQHGPGCSHASGRWRWRIWSVRRDAHPSSLPA